MSGSGEGHPHIEGAYSVSALCGEISEVVSGTFPDVWVVGEVQRLNASRAGHLYFELIEKGENDAIIGKLDVAVWRSYNRQVQAKLSRAGTALAEGQEIRCLGRVDFYPQGGRLQLIVSDIDPTFSLGRLEMRRRETIAALESAGLMDLNKALELAPVPLRVALVTSSGSAAYHDFMSSLAESPYGFEITFLHAAVQGATAEAEIASALAAASQLAVDCIALVRGGGSRSDLAVFDSRTVTQAVARAAFPVLAGLGHETDRSVVDMVAHTSFKTPTKVAEALVGRVTAAEAAVDRLGIELRHRSLRHLSAAREALVRAERGIARAEVRVAAARRRWEFVGRGLDRAARALLDRGRRDRQAIGERLVKASPRYLERAQAASAVLFERLPAAAGRRLESAARELAARRRLCTELAPQRALARGFSITRGDDGRILRHPGEAVVGHRIRSELAGGEITSRVEES